ncbi:hypothetical protein FC84_GL001130 [Lapidilactobacillus dextrinicus DSM 20335]|uniref:5-bromo-4-chloroindolyl phosphate hydrolysis protein n=1 Tax=Lapidilactobacillus dextrinicus DSM 20335 TaxID=1423738 RepID=A0A0R2BKI2_9LACO|nr:5-bromo-4-chloroindolyl phosphate hydrolysis family protein [Lapidilactobacillus dextrinicus]KRM78308.1 hypothetical protein FC84_GL001130 [Lapidilactobacillus dextrinicus DSM 20335]QFG47302.1 hypothetical protein LH506_07690 [Lapidilactobacillus dextrinicus]
MNKKNLLKLLYLIVFFVTVGSIVLFVVSSGTNVFSGLLTIGLVALAALIIIKAIKQQTDKNWFLKLCAGLFYFLTAGTVLGALLSFVDHGVDQDGSIALGMCAVFFAGISYLFVGIKTNRTTKNESFDQPISEKMLSHYQETGLSDTDINVFRETMADAKQQIIELQATMTAVPKLRAINLNHDTLEVSKAMFAALVREPQRLQEAADFLYKHLPNSVQIAKKYQEISRHEIKTADTYAVLDRSVEVLANLSEQMKKDYTNFVADDISELSSTLDSVNNPRQQPDFSSNSESSIAQMQDQLSQIQKDYLDKQAATKAADNQSAPQTNKDGDVTHD